jgi:hypothetical protein
VKYGFAGTSAFLGADPEKANMNGCVRFWYVMAHSLREFFREAATVWAYTLKNWEESLELAHARVLVRVVFFDFVDSKSAKQPGEPTQVVSYTCFQPALAITVDN